MSATVDFTAFAPIDDLFRELLAVSLTGVILYTPMCDAAGEEIIDFKFEYLNPAAQRMMRMPERPTLTHHGQWPHSREHGTFDFHVDAYVTGEPRAYNINYQADGYDNYYCLAARRVGDALLVSFTDTADQPRSPVELALRASQAAEKAARADAEGQRQRFYEVLMQLPAHVALHEGPEQRFTLVNPHYQRLAPGRNLVGQPIREAWPELVDQGILDVLDRVYETGEPFVANALPVRADFTRTGRLEQVYYNFFFLALRDAEGQINGVLNFSYDVTDLVRARQQVEQLNQDLEARVAERSAELVATAQRQAHEREAFYQIFEQTPALIALLREPGHRYEYVNPAYQALFPGRRLRGLDAADAVPELAAQGFVALLDQVYQTGDTYYGAEQAFSWAPVEGEPPRTYYFNFTYQAYREAGEIAGVSIFAFDVTAPVLARQR
ncbi:PAS domain-containing protein [Hymenobacter sp. ASUV-10]|uniref:PAS domain-containing protein n=1 Tax=Hymenobacter aranciens TaxID=3063996 RepID=A0ABT9BB75_9BACT|nr:PAS domain-containing protein [Hymenobacter sp. ASUV-10]MDO7873956.1 PAS domain-containing protein [Hymenobacter sp. ASUV-10]